MAEQKDTVMNGKALNVFISGCQTDELAANVLNYTASSRVIVDTPYNSGNASQKWKDMENNVRMNIPVFGLRIPRALSKVFAHPRYQAALKNMGIRIPEMCFDTFVRNKGPQNIDAFVSYLEKECPGAIEQKLAGFLRNFSKNVKELKTETIKNLGDWMNFMSESKFPQGWDSNLAFEDFLVMFGFEMKDALDFLKKEIPKTKDGATKMVKIQDEYVNWVIKTTSCWRYTGCLTDFVTWIFASMRLSFNPLQVDGKQKPGRQKEQEVVDGIEAFVKELDKDVPNFVVFDRHFMDAETDDNYVTAGMRMLNPAVEVIVQLPKVSDEDQNKPLIQKLASYYDNLGYQVFYDGTKNLANIIDTCKNVLCL